MEFTFLGKSQDSNQEVLAKFGTLFQQNVTQGISSGQHNVLKDSLFPYLAWSNERWRPMRRFYKVLPRMWSFYLVLFCLFLPHCIHLSPFVEAKRRKDPYNKYQWRTAPWGDCGGVSCGEGGIQLRSVNCVHSARNWSVIHSHCEKQNKPVDQRFCFKVCDSHKGNFRWKEGTWGECELAGTSPIDLDSEDKCGLGIKQIGRQQRNVTCTGVDDVNSIMQNHVCEKFSTAPVHTRPCDVPCPVNCATTLWSDWSTCSKSCNNGIQRRIRSVLATPGYGGVDCPTLSEVRACPELPKCVQDALEKEFFNKSHTFKFGNWTKCQPGYIQLSSPSNGKRKHRKDKRRRLGQVQVNLIGRRERHVTCLDGEGVPLGDSVTTIETCLITRHCETSDWSPWSVCTVTCGAGGTRMRKRDIKTIPAGEEARECPPLEESKICNREYNAAECKRYTWVTGGWGTCQAFNSATCGGGSQKRDVYCVVRDKSTIDQASTAVALGGKVGLREWAKIKPVNDEMCDEKYRPADWQECDVPCAVECEVGEWSDWSACAPETCDSVSMVKLDFLKSGRRRINAYKRRVREILGNIPDKDGCPHTVEVIPCEKGRCFNWQPVSVSRCRAIHGHCGVGSQSQTFVCKNMWSEVVADDNCLRTPALPLSNATLPCYVPCGADCVVSEWSNWTPCTHICKRGRKEFGNQTRFREVLANPGPDGDKCPSGSGLRQSRVCNQHKCGSYYWLVGGWGECQVKNNITPTITSSSIRSSDMFMSDDGNSTLHLPLSFPTANEEAVCGVGYQVRTVVCRKKGSDTVSDKLCGRKKPVITCDCTFPCPRDCIVSEWSEWSRCTGECDKVAANGNGNPGPVFQRRHRVVVQHRSDRGTPCPIQMEQKRQCADVEKCTSFRWRTSKWSDCVLTSKASSIFSDEDSSEVKCIGAMTRKVHCRRILSNGESVRVENRLCAKYSARSPPDSGKHCLTKCKPDLNFADWQEKIRCLAQVKTVHQSVKEMYFGRTNDDAQQSYVTMQKTAKPIGEWSSCNISQSTHVKAAALAGPQNSPQLHCGVGFRRRSLACYVEGTDVIVDNSHCHYRDFQQEECEIPCPVNCKLSSWSSWGQCGDKEVGRRGISTDGREEVETTPAPEVVLPCGQNLRMRYQYVVEKPQHGGRTCPLVDSLGLRYETEACQTACDTMFWLPFSWRQCSIDQYGTFSNCGSGLQSREVECYKTDTATGHRNVAKVILDQRLCDLETMPYGSRSCSAPCPGECVYSDWSSWGECQLTSGLKDISCNGVRKRSRTLLRKPDPRKVFHDDTSLPDSLCGSSENIVEMEVCRLNANCFTYSSLWTEWSSCTLPHSAKCGSGIRRRRSNCISSNGLPVHKKKCVSTNINIPAPESEPCRVLCAIDCEVSSWSVWSRCPAACSLGATKTRRRKIIREPSRLGRPCPSFLETSPCQSKPCHTWKLSGWSECLVSGDNCGFGLQFRQIKCFQHDNIEVSNILCEKQNGEIDQWFGESDLRRDCQVACAGECQMTEWSSWGNCHVRCLDGGTKVAGTTEGFQTRSRVGFIVGQMSEGGCPASEVEEKPCPLDEGKCFFYEWRTGSFHRGKRPVWCQRSTNDFNVSSGCHENLKPQEELYCIQDCETILNSFCTERGVCGCNEGFRSVVRPEGTLDSCVEIQPNDETRENQLMDPTLNDPPSVDGRSIVTIPKSEGKSATSSATMEGATLEQTSEVVIQEAGFFENLDLFTDDGDLKVWVYGVIGGLVLFIIFTIVIIYLICYNCRYKKSGQNYSGRYYGRSLTGKHKRRHNSSGSNVGVGMVIGMGTPRFPPSSSAMSHTSSTSRSGFYQDHHESGVWK